MRRLVILALIAVVVIVFVFEPRARALPGRAWNATFRRWAAPDRNIQESYDKIYWPRDDPYYHRIPNCPRMTGQGVVYPLAKARELARPCPRCKPPG